MQHDNLLSQEERHADTSSRSAFKTGRTVGIILLLQLAAALTLPFILSKPITLRAPDFLANVAEHSFQVRSAVLLSFVGSGLTVYLGITAFRIFRLYGKSIGLAFLVACAVSCTLDIVHAGTIMSMLSVSNEFVNSKPADLGLYKEVAVAVALVRRSAHSTQLLAIGAWMFVFYISLFRFRLIPRVLAIVGVIGVALQFVGVTLMMFLGYPLISEMAVPLLPIQVTVAIWLIVKGFSNSDMQYPNMFGGK